MSDNTKQKTAEIINPGLGDIEKVRDILFGKYVNSFEGRFAELESRMEADLDELKQRLTDKISEMDEAVNKSMARFDERLAEEQQSRDGELVSMQAMLGEAETKLQHAISMMEDETSQNLQAIRDSIGSAREELAKESAEQQRKLEDDKVGRQSLAHMLDEIALKLRGDS